MATAIDPPSGAGAVTQQDRRHRSIFELPSDFFDSCRLISPSATLISKTSESSTTFTAGTPNGGSYKEDEEATSQDVVVQASPRWTCNTCKADFESLQEQRLHFKSDIHRFNVKLSIAGKNIVKEEDFDELTSDSFKDLEVSSISGSEDEAQKASFSQGDPIKGSNEVSKRKLFIHLKTGERVSLWKSLLFSESEDILYEDNKAGLIDGGFTTYLKEAEVIKRLKNLIHEPRDKTCLRIVLLASGGHFAGCVFDGTSVVAQKTFHRYVVRAKAGKKQSSKDASGKTIHSAGAALRRYNEVALKKDIQELLAAWKPFFDASSSVFLYAPSNNRHLLFNGEKPYFSSQHGVVRSIPLTVRRPTLKEAQRIYSYVTQVTYQIEENEDSPTIKEEPPANETLAKNGRTVANEEDVLNDCKSKESSDICANNEAFDEKIKSSECESDVVGASTELHVASQSGDADKVLELLEQGLDPCVKDERGRTPYMLAKEKEVRNTFRRFMALNLDKWDWQAAKVPSALTKEMEDSQAAKQAEKDAKRKARAKELKKLRRAKEKKAQVEAALSQNATGGADKRGTNTLKQSQPSGVPKISKEEELKRAQAAEREKRAAAAERRIAAAAQGSSTTVAASTSESNSGLATDLTCSCCHASLAGKVPFHRYNYKYCSTTCMHLHREMLEDL